MATPWQAHAAKWRDCTRCPLHAQRDRIVLARGTIPCRVLVIGEAPGASEDAIGQPFQGPAGKILDSVLESAIPAGVPVALTNLVACYPAIAKAAGTNEPESREIEACSSRLVEFIQICSPALVVAVGDLAKDWMPESVKVPVVKIVHPSFILSRMPLVQQGYAIKKATVAIATALSSIVS